MVDLMKNNPSIKIRLEGHTDNRGSKKGNLQLSKSRARAVKEYLTSKGIPSRRISWKGYGGSRPIADNEDPETRKMNRRVEFTIVKK
ncbi:MAG: OmpA family protein [Bacteroidota bacterium]